LGRKNGSYVGAPALQATYDPGERCTLPRQRTLVGCTLECVYSVQCTVYWLQRERGVLKPNHDPNPAPLPRLPEDVEVSQFADSLPIGLRTDLRGFAGGALLSASAAGVRHFGFDMRYLLLPREAGGADGCADGPTVEDAPGSTMGWTGLRGAAACTPQAPRPLACPT
jgi:hypothetical protein